jgi:arsenite/tail-anchored protein-transporting ATPase
MGRAMEEPSSLRRRMRILLFTGKGGVGKTTVAAATALQCAAAGLRTIVLSTDPAHSLADAFDRSLGDEPIAITRWLDGQQLDARVRFEAAWADVRDYVVDVLGWAGADAVEAEELAVVPGLDEVFALGDLKAHAASGRYDVIVVDCAPTAETLRLLSLPDVLAWYMDKLFDAQRRITRLARPVVARFSSIPVAPDAVFGAVRRFYDRLDGVRELLTDGSVTSARLVVTPERLVVAEARRTFTYLSLFGYHVDAVVANRLLPVAVDDPWFADWRDHQRGHLEAIADAFAPLPVLTAELARREVVGVDALLAFGAELYRDQDPAARLAHVEPLRVRGDDDAMVLSLHLPFSGAGDVELGRSADELFLAVGPYRRAVVLPDSLRTRDVVGAKFSDGRLEVEFGRR